MSRKILFVHQNFPAQFPHIADALVKRGDQVVALGGPTSKERAGIKLVRWSNQRGTTQGIFDAAVRSEADLIRAQAAVGAALEIKKAGFEPDLIIGHPGWGETIHLKDIFPGARMILFGEFYYRHIGADLNFDREFEMPSLQAAMRTNGKNATQSLAYTMADMIVSPTAFQASTFPPAFRRDIRVHHEGVDLSKAMPRPFAKVKLADGRAIDKSTPVITFINRNFERLRGFHIFMRALPAFLDAVPEAQIIVIGSDGNGYGGARADGQSWRQAMLAEVGARLDQSRVHFVGMVDHARMIDIISIGAAHVYYTYPFTLSWSLVEAMACQCLVIGSDTAPVRDAIADGETGMLRDFFDVDALSRVMVEAVRFPGRFEDMRVRARKSAIAHFDRATVGVPGWLRLVDEVLS